MIWAGIFGQLVSQELSYFCSAMIVASSSPSISARFQGLCCSGNHSLFFHHADTMPDESIELRSLASPFNNRKMNSNPYEFSNVDDPAQNMNAAGHACPELFDVIHIKGSLSKSEALRLAAKCRAIPQRDTKTGKVTNTNYGLLLLCGAGMLLIYCTGAKLVNDIRTANSEFENLLFWMTNIVVPLVSIATLIVLFWRHRFRIDTADPPIWGDVEIELDAKWYAANRYCQNGKLRQALYRWPMTDVLASRDAWLLHPPGLCPVLIPRIWLTATAAGQLSNIFSTP
jgi:hypothetical protein